MVFLILIFIIIILVFINRRYKNEGLVNENGEIVVRNMSGNIVNIKVFDKDSDISGISTTGIGVGGNEFSNVVSVNYKPLSNASKILIKFDSGYTIPGTGYDSFVSRIAVIQNGVAKEISSKEQIFANASGGGTRSPTLFPISGIYNNTSFEPVTINVQARRSGGDDTMYMNSSSANYRTLTVIEYLA